MKKHRIVISYQEKNSCSTLPNKRKPNQTNKQQKQQNHIDVVAFVILNMDIFQ